MALFLSSRQQLFGCSTCNTVLFGGSYGGMLSAWFMLKYPHLAEGALAASAPIDLYPGENKSTAFMEATLDVFSKFGSSTCKQMLRSGLDRMAELSATSQGRAQLGSELCTCKTLESAVDAKRLDFYIRGALSTLAMLDYPYPADFVTPMPANPVAVACHRAAHLESNISALKVVTDIFVNYRFAPVP